MNEIFQIFRSAHVKFFMIFFPFILFSECKKKKVDVDTTALDCKPFRLSAASFVVLSDASCNGSEKRGKIRVSCRYDGNATCFKSIQLAAKFYTSNSTEIGNVQYPTQFEVGDSRLGISNDSIIFNFDYAYLGTTDPKSLSFVYLNYFIESGNTDLSNKAQLRVNSQCSTIDSSTYKVVKEYKFTSDTLDVTVYDAIKEDGDQISLWLNDTLRLDNFVLKKAPSVFRYKLKVGKNRLIVFAITEGGMGSNTPAIEINKRGSMNVLPTLVSGDAIDIYYTPKP